MGRTLLFAAATLFSCFLSTASQAITLVGTELSLRTISQSSSTSQLFTTSFPATSTVGSGVEFPDVASLYNGSPVPPGFANSLVNVAIDAGADYLEIDFTNSLPFSQFATGFQNTYVFTFDQAVAPTITDAVVDPNVTTLGIDASRVSFAGNELFVNVSSLMFDTTTFARINLTAVSSGNGPNPGNGNSNPATNPNDLNQMAAVPLPMSGFLLLAGIGLLGFQRRVR